MSKPARLILPTYNEAESLQPLVQAILQIRARTSPGCHRVLVVDDDSPDETGRLADALAAREPAVEVLHRPAREGLDCRPASIAESRTPEVSGATSWTS